MKNSFNVLELQVALARDHTASQALKIALEYVKKQGAEVRLLEPNRIVLPYTIQVPQPQKR